MMHFDYNVISKINADFFHFYCLKYSCKHSNFTFDCCVPKKNFNLIYPHNIRHACMDEARLWCNLSRKEHQRSDKGDHECTVQWWQHCKRYICHYIT